MASSSFTWPTFFRRFWLPLILIVLVLLAGFWWLNRNGEQLKVNTAVVQRGNLEVLVTATGMLQPRDYVDVGAQVSGQLKILHVEVGTSVKAGDLLAEIDPTVYLARVDATRAQLRNQRAQMQDRQAQLTLAEIHFRRQENLHKEDATTQESVQNAEASLRSARAQIEALDAQIEQTESTLRAEEANLDYARIYAPMDGTVVSIDARQGQTLNAAQTAPILMRIADLATMTVQAQVSEADISQLKPGMPVYFTTLGSQGLRWQSELNRIEPTPEVLNNVVLYNALFDVPNQNGNLLPQMTAQVFFITAQAKEALLIPASALTFTSAAGAERGPARTQERAREDRTREDRSTRSNEQPRQRPAQVEVILPDGKHEMREVMVGVSNRVQAEIVSGLAEGDRVVTSIRQSAQRSTQSGNVQIPRMMR